MGGGYIECGEWEGTDKSAKRLFNTFSALREFAPTTLHPNLLELEQFSKFPFRLLDATYVIPVELASSLIEPLEQYISELTSRKANSTRDWGAAINGPYDLLEACKRSRETGCPVEVWHD